MTKKHNLRWQDVPVLNPDHLSSWNNLDWKPLNIPNSENAVYNAIGSNIRCVRDGQHVYTFFFLKWPRKVNGEHCRSVYFVKDCPTRDSVQYAGMVTKNAVGVVAQALGVSSELVCVAARVARQRNPIINNKVLLVYCSKGFAIRNAQERVHIDISHPELFPWEPMSFKEVIPLEKYEQDIAEAFDKWVCHPDNVGMSDFLDRCALKSRYPFGKLPFYYCIIGGYGTGKSALLKILQGVYHLSENIDNDERQGNFTSEVMDIPIFTTRDDTALAFTKKEGRARKSTTTSSRVKKTKKFEQSAEYQRINFHVMAFNFGQRNDAEYDERRLRGGLMTSHSAFQGWKAFCKAKGYWNKDGHIEYHDDIIETVRKLLHNRYVEAQEDGGFDFEEEGETMWTEACSTEFVLAFKSLHEAGAAHEEIGKALKSVKENINMPSQMQKIISRLKVTETGKLHIGYYLFRDIAPELNSKTIKPYFKYFLEAQGIDYKKDKANYNNLVTWHVPMLGGSKENTIRILMEKMVQWYEVVHNNRIP